jgi:GGDEF domain-containing protein
MHEQQQDETLRVFLAMTAPLARARLRQALRQDPRLSLVGDVTSAAALLAQISETDAQFILCDEYILADPDVALFARRRSPSIARFFVLMVSNPDLFTYHGDVPIAASLRLDLAGARIADQLAPILDPPQFVPTLVADMEDRFMVVGRGLDDALLGADPLPRHNPHRTRQLMSGDGTVFPHVTVSLDPSSRRQPSEARAEIVNRLALVQSRLAEHRDSVTGLASPQALDSALHALQGTKCPTAVVVLQFWAVQAAGRVKRLSLDNAALQRAGVLLQATVRQEDLACRLEGTCFALVLAGLDEESASRPVGRIRTVMASQLAATGGQTVTPVVGVGYWQPSMAPTQPLELAWQEMATESNRLMGSFSNPSI